LKRRNFTFSVTQDMVEVIKQVEQCNQYAWIVHDKDTDPDTGELIEKHVHAYIEFPNPRSFASVASLIGIAENMVCKVIDKNGILQYLIHKNQPDKYQYPFEDITSNFDLEPFFMNKSNHLWEDFNKLRNHHISPDEFYQMHKNEIDGNAFYQKLRIFDMISSYVEIAPPQSPTPPIHGLIK